MKTLNSWNKQFALVDPVGLDQVKDDAVGVGAKPVTYEDIEAKAEFTRQAQNFCTPLRKWKGAAFEEMSTLGYSPYNKQASIPITDVLKADTPEEMKQKAKIIFEKIDNGMIDMSEVLLHFLIDYDMTVKLLSLGISALEFGPPLSKRSLAHCPYACWQSLHHLKLGELSTQICFDLKN